MKTETAYELTQTELDQVAGGLVTGIIFGTVTATMGAFALGMEVGDRLAAKYKK